MYNKRNAKLRELLARPGVLAIPGCHDGISARMIQKVGYEVCYLGGTTSGEQCEIMRPLVLAVSTSKIK